MFLYNNNDCFFFTPFKWGNLASCENSKWLTQCDDIHYMCEKKQQLRHFEKCNPKKHWSPGFSCTTVSRIHKMMSSSSMGRWEHQRNDCFELTELNYEVNELLRQETWLNNTFYSWEHKSTVENTHWNCTGETWKKKKALKVTGDGSENLQKSLGYVCDIIHSKKNFISRTPGWLR